MDSSNVESLIRAEFSSSYTLDEYSQKAKAGLWKSELAIVKKYFKKRKGSVLDLGCGTGRTSGPLAELGYSVVGIDFIPGFIEIAKKNHPKVKFCVKDVRKTGFSDSSFDYALFSFNGWEQIPGKNNRLAALEETHRVLKPGGMFVFTTHKRVLNYSWIKRGFIFYFSKLFHRKMREIDYGDIFWIRGDNNMFQFIHISSLREVKSLLKKAGFKILEIKTTKDLADTIHEYVYYFFICSKVKEPLT